MDKKLSYLLGSLIPSYIQDEYPQYVNFVAEYLKAIEEDTGPFEVLNSITQFIDIDITPEDTLNDFIYQYLNSFPIDYLSEVNIREFVSNAKNFYSQKGNEASVRFIFNVLGSSLDFYYPAEDIFTVSESTLSGSKHIHDNKYYAYYVYEIVTDLDYREYEDIIRKMSHPIGEKLFFRKVNELHVTEIFDLDVRIANSVINQYQEIFVGDITKTNTYDLWNDHSVNFKKDGLSDFIVDYVDETIEDWFTFSVYKLLYEDPEPSFINFELNNTDISFSGSTISSTVTYFDNFYDGDVITVSNSQFNDGNYNISGDPTANSITVSETFTAESALNDITISLFYRS